MGKTTTFNCNRINKDIFPAIFKYLGYPLFGNNLHMEVLFLYTTEYFIIIKTYIMLFTSLTTSVKSYIT